MLLLNGDCIEEMQKLIDDGKQVDSVVTDPPYHLTSIVQRDMEKKVLHQQKIEMDFTKDRQEVLWVKNGMVEILHFAKKLGNLHINLKNSKVDIYLQVSASRNIIECCNRRCWF